MRDYYPGAVWSPVTYIGEAGALVQPARGWVLHVQDGDNDPGPMFSAATQPNRRFSHLWVAKAGQVRQYQRLTRESWAQGAGGNPAWWSVETEGTPDQPLTDAQLAALAAWHVWCGAADVASSSPSVAGIGTHGMGGDAWGGHPDCPGPIRAGQRAEILRRAALLRGGPTVTPAEISAVADAVLARLLAYAPPTGALMSDGKPLTLPWVLARDYQALGRIEVKLAGLPSAQDVAAAVAAALAPKP